MSLLTCLGSRLAVERQIGKRAITCVFQCQMYTHLKSRPCRSQLFTNGIYIYRLFGTQLQSRYINMQLLPINLCTASLKYTYEWLENSELIMYITDGTEHELHSYIQYIYNITTITTMQVVLTSATLWMSKAHMQCAKTGTVTYIHTLARCRASTMHPETNHGKLHGE